MSDLADEPRSALRRSALEWLRVSDLALRRLRLHDEVKDTRVDVDRPDVDSAASHLNVQAITDARLVLIAYKHVYLAFERLKKVEQLSPEEELAYGKFHTAYQSRCVGVLRDVLEHWEDYVVGCGWRPEFRLVASRPRGVRRDWHWGCLHRPVVTILLDGREFELNSVEAAARHLWQALDPDNAPR